MALSLPDATITLALEAHELINQRLTINQQHDMLDAMLHAAHRNSLGLLAARILTIAEIAEVTGLSVPTLRDRIKASGVQPAKTAGMAHLYAYEDVPAIVNAHLANTETLEYVPARIRNAIARVKRKPSIAVLQDLSNVKWANLYGKPASVTFEIDSVDFDLLKEECERDGWQNPAVLIRALAHSYIESLKTVTTKRKEKEHDAPRNSAK